MNSKKSYQFTELELDALQETLNISFGSAASDLADLMDMFIKLNVPCVKIIEVANLMNYIKKDISSFENCSIVEQKYHGDFQGTAFLIFPYGIEKELISYIQNPEAISFESDELIELEKEVLMEIGNILIGACIGRIFELLESSITYLPPQSMTGESFQAYSLNTPKQAEGKAITMKTSFSFEDRRVKGDLFLLNYQDSIPHLKKALSKFQG